MPNAFLLFRYLTGLMLASALIILCVIMFLHSALNFAKEGVGVLGYVGALFTSGFTKGDAPPEPRGWIMTLPQIGLAVMFIAMIATLTTPTQKLYLHLVAAMGVVAVIWYIRMMLTGLQLEIFCLPLFPAWFIYYALCIFWFRPPT
jgi:hypothetical protein